MKTQVFIYQFKIHNLNVLCQYQKVTVYDITYQPKFVIILTITYISLFGYNFNFLDATRVKFTVL